MYNFKFYLFNTDNILMMELLQTDILILDFCFKISNVLVPAKVFSESKLSNKQLRNKNDKHSKSFFFVLILKNA